MISNNVLTPHYFLLNNGVKMAPEVTQYHSERTIHAYYGFSSKPQYDLFSNNSNGVFQPYPLLARYLESCIAEYDLQTIYLIAVDAGGLGDEELRAVTFKNLYDALRDNRESVEVSYRLVRHVSLNQYSLCKPPLNVSI